jgi:uncharacterized protein YjiS (DUF1127 family)
MSQSTSVQEPDRSGSTMTTDRERLSNWTCIIGNWLKHRQGRQELSSLDDRLLDDIGISREDAGKPFRRPGAA